MRLCIPAVFGPHQAREGSPSGVSYRAAYG